jgi:SAM-dependent methyltransferase
MNALFKFLLNIFPRTFLIRLSVAFQPLLKIIYNGSEFKDPIDGSTFRKFLPYGYENVRQNVLSPSTLSLERHRLLWLFLQRKTDFFSKPHKLLHFAPEQAFYKRFKKLNHLDYTTTDLNSPLADVKADICDLPFEDDSFDVILCNHVLEHIKDDVKAMQELFRVLKPGGWAILQIPQDLNRKETFEDDSITDPKARTKIFGQYDHVRVYGLDYFDKLSSVGFDVHPIEYTKDFTEEEKTYYSLPNREFIPYVIKPCV